MKIEKIIKQMLKEEEKKNMFKPRNLEGRERQYLKQIGMEPIIKLLNEEDGNSVSFQMSTPTDAYDWSMNNIFLLNKTGFNTKSLGMSSDYYDGVKKLIIDYLEQEIPEFACAVDGHITISNGELIFNLNVECIDYLSKEKSYKL